MSYRFDKRRVIFILLILLLAGCRSHPRATPTFTQEQAAIGLASVSIESTTPMPVVLENGWYVYTDPDGEFTLSYPPDTIISAGQNPVDQTKNITLQFPIPEKSYQGMSLRVEPNPKRLQSLEITKQLFEISTQKSASAEFTNSLKQITVGGMSAVQTSIPSTNTEVTIVIPYGDKVLIVAPVHDTFVTKVEKETLDLFYQIVSTLKFTNTP